MGGGREPREVTTSTLLPDEFEFFQQYQGKTTGTWAGHRAHVGPIHRLEWIMCPECGPDGLERIISAAEDGDVKMWYEDTEVGLVQMR